MNFYKYLILVLHNSYTVHLNIQNNLSSNLTSEYIDVLQLSIFICMETVMMDY